MAEFVLIIMFTADPRAGAISQQAYLNRERCEAAAEVVRQQFPMPPSWRKLVAVCVER
ncbi:MAG: hypothetical protein LCH88_08970 [Proteobacteria bacterium]|nr:hypothetical protein [Pseudomonadota bacterium]